MEIIYIKQETQILEGAFVQLISINYDRKFINDMVGKISNESFSDFLNRSNERVLSLINEIKSPAFPILEIKKS